MKKGNTKPDIKLKDFWRSNERFADLFNAVLFNRQEIPNPLRLCSQTTG